MIDLLIQNYSYIKDYCLFGNSLFLLIKENIDLTDFRIQLAKINKDIKIKFI